MSQKKLDDYDAHEALDRVFLIQSMLEKYVQSHPWIVAHPRINDLIEEASRTLAEAYQAIGRNHL